MATAQPHHDQNTTYMPVVLLPRLELLQPAASPALHVQTKSMIELACPDTAEEKARRFHEA